MSLPRRREHIRQGACMYFVRLQCSHLNEAMMLIRELQDKLQGSQTLQLIFNKQPQDVKRSFENLVTHLREKGYSKSFTNDVEKIRHNVGFHYQSSKIFKKAINKRSDSKKSRSTITRGDNINLWRFNFADDIVDTLVCREIWKINAGENLRIEADKHLDFSFDLCKDFLNFCGEFIFQYIRDHGAE